MKKFSGFIAIIAIMVFASLALASWKGTGLRLGITTEGSKTSVRNVAHQNGTIKVNGTVSSPEAGTIYYNASDDKFYSCNSTGCSTFN